MTDIRNGLRVIAPHTKEWQLEILKHRLDKGVTKTQRLLAVETILQMVRQALKRDDVKCRSLDDAINDIGDAYDSLFEATDKRQAAWNRANDDEGVEADSDRNKDEELGN